MPYTGFRLLQSPNNFQGVKLGWWIIHKWENCPCCQVKLLYRVLLSPFSLWWLISLCNVLYTLTINLFYFIYFIAGSGIQLASQPFCQNFTGMALVGLLFNRWAKKTQFTPGWPLPWVPQDPAPVRAEPEMQSMGWHIPSRALWSSMAWKADPAWNAGVFAMLLHFFLWIFFLLQEILHSRKVWEYQWFIRFAEHSITLAEIKSSRELQFHVCLVFDVVAISRKSSGLKGWGRQLAHEWQKQLNPWDVWIISSVLSLPFSLLQ